MTKKISAMTELTTPASGDYVPVVDISEAQDADKNKRLLLSNIAKVVEQLAFKDATELTIATGVITVAQSAHKLQPESGTTDDLDTISGTSAGDTLVLYASDKGTDTITIKHGTGNISCIGEADIELSEGAVVGYSDGTTVYVSGGGGGAPGGWMEVSGWSYASATRIAYTNANLILAVGDQVRYKQGGAYKYGSVYAVTSTYFDVTGGSDYTVANAAITDAAFSKGGGVGHPVWYSYTSTITYTGGATSPTSVASALRFVITDRLLTIVGLLTFVIGSGDRTGTLLTPPIPYLGDSAGSSGGAWTDKNPGFYTAFTDKLFLDHSTMPADSGTYYVRVGISYRI